MFDDEQRGDHRSYRSADEELIRALDGSHRQTCLSQRGMLALIVEADRRESWRDSGARELAHWLSMRYGISCWKARRWIAAGHALEALPGLSGALADGELGLDKVVELARFATARDEADLIAWAKRVSCAAVRHRGDVWARSAREDVVEAEHARSLSWWVVRRRPPVRAPG